MNGKVLIVDDEAGIRKILKMRLGNQGYEIQEAENGLRALQILRDHSFDAVLCDIKMPEMDGLEMISELRTTDTLTPVIMLTGFIDLETAVEVMKKGAFDYLTKPIHNEALLLAVEKAVDFKRVLFRNKLLEEEKQRYHEELKRRVNEQTRIIRAMFDLANQLNSLDSLDLVLESVIDALLEFIPCRRVCIMLLDTDESILRMARSRGIPEKYNTVRDSIHEPLWSTLFERGGVRLVNAGSDWGERPMSQWIQQFLPHPFLQAALMGPKNRLGVINLAEKSNLSPFSDEDAEILSYITASAAVAINNQFTEQRLENSYLATIKALAMAIEAKDPYTRGHSERVADLSVRVARRLGLNEKQVRVMRFAGILHDVGKIGVPGNILTKPARLTVEEFDQIRLHPEIGERMILEADFLKEARPIIRQHHERIDGTGYPDGLEGDEICTGAKIMAVADAYDAMTTDRTYRTAMTAHQAVKELVRVSGTQLDPECVQALILELQILEAGSLQHS